VDGVVRSYWFDVSGTRVHTECFGEEGVEGWDCTALLEIDDQDFTPRELKALKREVKAQFEEDLRSELGPIEVFWSDEKRHPLLRLHKGDKITYQGEEVEVEYVVPEQKFCGVRTATGKLLNKIRFHELSSDLFHKN
jgi:hypothetical protein